MLNYKTFLERRSQKALFCRALGLEIGYEDNISWCIKWEKFTR